MSNSEKDSRRFFIDETDINVSTTQAVIAMMHRADLKMVINKGNEELATPNRSYENNSDDVLKEAISAAQLVYDDEDATIETITDQITLVEVAIDNLKFSISEIDNDDVSKDGGE